MAFPIEGNKASSPKLSSIFLSHLKKDKIRFWGVYEMPPKLSNSMRLKQEEVFFGGRRRTQTGG